MVGPCTCRLPYAATVDMLAAMSAPQSAKPTVAARNGLVGFIRSEYPLFIGQLA